MILTPHLLAGAAIASKVQPVPLALLLAFLSHYLLDLLPHGEYPINNIQEKKWKKSLVGFLRVGLDASFGGLLVLLFSDNIPVIFAGAFLAVLPDGFNFLNLVFPNSVLKIQKRIHHRIHFPETKKIPLFLGILSQIAVGVLAIFFLMP